MIIQTIDPQLTFVREKDEQGKDHFFLHVIIELFNTSYKANGYELITGMTNGERLLLRLYVKKEEVELELRTPIVFTVAFDKFPFKNGDLKLELKVREEEEVLTRGEVAHEEEEEEDEKPFPHNQKNTVYFVPKFTLAI